MFFPSLPEQKSPLRFLLLFRQGSSKANVHMEWDKIWSLNKKVCRQGKFCCCFFFCFLCDVFSVVSFTRSYCHCDDQVHSVLIFIILYCSVPTNDATELYPY